MTLVMNNMELTRGYEHMVVTVSDLSTRLGIAISAIEKIIKLAVADTKAMYDSIRNDMLPIMSNVDPMPLSVEEMSVRATAEYQKLDQLGINTLDRITSVSNDMQQQKDLLHADDEVESDVRKEGPAGWSGRTSKNSSCC